MVRTLPLDTETRPELSRILAIAAVIAVHAMAFLLLLVPLANSPIEIATPPRPRWVLPKELPKPPIPPVIVPVVPQQPEYPADQSASGDPAAAGEQFRDRG